MAKVYMVASVGQYQVMSSEREHVQSVGRGLMLHHVVLTLKICHASAVAYVLSFGCCALFLSNLAFSCSNLL